MNDQNTIWTSTGVPRKNHTYDHADPDTTGLGDSRMTASTVPSTTPITMASAVSSSVATSPCITVPVVKYFLTRPQRQAGLENSVCTSIAASTATETHRPGCRTGTAVIRSGAADPATSVPGTIIKK